MPVDSIDRFAGLSSPLRDAVGILAYRLTTRLTFIHDQLLKIAPSLNTGKANFIGFSVHNGYAIGFAERF